MNEKKLLASCSERVSEGEKKFTENQDSVKKLTENQDPVSPLASRRNINESEHKGSQKRVTKSPSNLNQDPKSSHPKRQKPCCPNCGKNQFGECWRIVGQCYRCGDKGHRNRDCPLRLNASRTNSKFASSRSRKTGQSH